MKVLFVTSPNERCGIREYGRMLLEELAGDNEVEVEECTNPDSFTLGLPKCDIIHVNHHAALHSSWTAERVKEYQKAGYVVTVTQHDTFEKLEIMLERGMPDFRVANGLVVHEEVEGLETGGLDNRHVIHQGVLPAPSNCMISYREMLGVFGFDFPWKNFDLAARAAREAGWALRIISPGMSLARQEEIRAINPMAVISTGWLSARDVVSILGRCTATAFLYSTGNSGTSGAIRLGIAARRPMVAFRSRQNRDLENESAIRWVENEAVAIAVLMAWGYENTASEIVIDGRVEDMKELADRDSWVNVAKKYKAMWQEAWDGR